MKHHILPVLLLLACASPLLCAQEKSPEEIKAKKEEEIYNMMETQLEHEIKFYELEDWQIFKIDSTLVHDYMAMLDDYDVLTKKGVQNMDFYQEVQDKWMESIHQTYLRVLSEEQKVKYLKSGAGKAAKARERRAARRRQ